MKRKRKIAAFTLVEILIVIIIISILAGFSVPNFTRSIMRARSRDAINNLTAIHAAQLIYRSLNGNFLCCADLACINAINGANSLNIIANGATYTCNNAGACPTVPTQCSAVNAGNFTVTVTLANPIILGANPACASAGGNCP